MRQQRNRGGWREHDRCQRIEPRLTALRERPLLVETAHSLAHDADLRKNGVNAIRLHNARKNSYFSVVAQISSSLMLHPHPYCILNTS